MDQLNIVLVVSFAVSILAFIVAWLLYRWLTGIKVENKRALELSELIRDGSNTFLKREYRYLAYFCFVVACLILLFLPKPIWQGGVLDNIWMVLAYITGTIFSGLAGKIGIAVATRANVRAAEAAVKHGRSLSFLSGFRGGAVMGMAVVGSSLLGVCAIYALTGDALTMLGFSFGASTMALFAKAGGGIFTKTADISADLVGKVTLGLPEDDPRNPAVIADNVGDNVGDVAGMGADLFDSNVAAMAAALVMGISLDQQAGGNLNVMAVFCYAAVGLLASIIGVGTARLKEGANPTRVLNFSTYVTTAVYLALTGALTALLNFSWRVWGAAAVGLAVGLIIGLTTDYFTNDERPPVRAVAKMSKSGPAFTILSGISYSFLSVLPAMVADWIGDAPRYFGSREAWTLRHPFLGNVSIDAGRYWPNDAVTITSGRSSSKAAMSASSRQLVGCISCIPRSFAHKATGGAANLRPLPLGRSGCVITREGDIDAASR
jgi:K(+)-stimulated pyrophosphate-energized sodium pump